MRPSGTKTLLLSDIIEEKMKEKEEQEAMKEERSKIPAQMLEIYNGFVFSSLYILHIIFLIIIIFLELVNYSPHTNLEDFQKLSRFCPPFATGKRFCF